VKHNVTKAADHVNAVTTIGSALFGSFAGFRAGQQATGTAASSSRSPAPPNPASSQQQATSGWARWAAPAAYALGGAILAGAAAGGAYYAKEHLGNGYQWMMDHMKYVGNLWDESGLNERVEALVDVEEKHGVVFRKCVPGSALIQQGRTDAGLVFIPHSLLHHLAFLRHGHLLFFHGLEAEQLITL